MGWKAAPFEHGWGETADEDGGVGVRLVAMTEHDGASVTPIDAARSRRRRSDKGAGRDALDRMLDASLDLARAERAGIRLDGAELMILDCCDEIGGVRDIVASERGDPYPRDPDAPTDPRDPLYDF